MDVKIKTNDLKFKLRVTGVFIYKDKILLDEYDNNTFILPGGYVNLKEDSNEAILRELKEEIGYEFKINKFMGTLENFFTNRNNENTHEINFYYKVDLDNKNNIENLDLNKIEDDHGYIIHHHFKWIKLKDLDNINLEPRKINIQVLVNNEEIFHYIIKDNK